MQYKLISTPLTVGLDVESAFADTTQIAVRKFDRDLARKYSGPDFTYEYTQVTNDFWSRMMAGFAQWLKGLFQFSDAETSMALAVNIVRTIAIVIVIFIVYMIVRSILNKEGQWIFGKNSKRSISHTDIENIHSTDFEKLVADALRAGDRRLSIRYYYLWLLRRMSDRGIIIWDPEKTNTDYVYEIANTSLKADFEYLSYLYNYIWYGEFELDDQMFDKAKMAFEKSISGI